MAQAIAFNRDNTYEPRSYMGLALAASLLIHLLLIYLLVPRPGQSVPPPLILNVSFEPPSRSADKAVPALTAPEQAPLKQQIVSSPENDGNSALAPERTSFLSDKNSSTERESIKRGAGPDAGAFVSDKRGPKPGAEAAAQKKIMLKPKAPAEAEGATSEARPAPLRQLTLDESTTTSKFSAPAPEKAGSLNEILRRESSTSKAVDPGNYTAFSRPFGSGAAFIGQSGSADYLPDLPDGDITLLNTKASLFAVFVRRVATQVFSQLRSQGWESLRYSDITAINEYTSVRAVLSPEGRLLRAIIESPGGSRNFDQLLVRSVQKGAVDPNPPPAAAAPDGNFHIIFQAKSWTQIVGNPRTGAPSERRWLLLATGLE